MDQASHDGSPRSVWDTVRAVLVILFAFLAASFPAVNSDLWQHLAAGRALFDGSYTLGTDPFAYTTHDRSWINHAWLFDAATFGLHHALGGSALVVGKALLIAILAGLLVGCCGNEPRRWLAILLVAVSLVALSPYALLRPVCVSLLFLGFTLTWLERHRAVVSWRAAVPMLIVFVLWANLDEWFLLGPLTVFLWWLGSLVGPRRPREQVAARGISLGWVAVAGLALALVNPHHVRAFTVPALLDPTIAEDWFDDVQDRAALRSPLDWAVSEASLRQPPHVAYGALVLLGMSFLLRRGGLPVGRLLIWAVFLALSVYRSGAIPFFAVVAGPITALNLQEWLAHRDSTSSVPAPPFWTRVLRFASVPLLAGAVLAAWTGWIRSYPGEPRSWQVVLDPGLEAAAHQLAEWHLRRDVSAEARGLPTSAAAAHVLAWACPAEKCFCDDRPHLYSPETRADFAAMRQALFRPGDKEAAVRWRELLDKHRITHLIVDHADERELHLGLGRLFSSPAWTLHHLRGGVTILAKRDPAARDQMVLRAPAVDAWVRAFRPSADERAPAKWPGRDPMPRTWLDALDRPALADDPDRKQCLAWQAHFDAQRGGYLRRTGMQWGHGMAASVIGLIAAETQPWGPAPGTLLRWAWLSDGRESKTGKETASLHDVAVQVFQRFVSLRDDGPPGTLFAAIRAGRRAVHVNPEDARAHLYLGEAYLRLRRQTRERALSPAFITLDHVRRIQALTALRHAVRLDPGMEIGHELLAGLYSEIGYEDLSLEHVRALVKLLDASRAEASRSAGKADATAKRRFEHWENLEKQLARQVRDAQLALRAEDLDVVAKARIALRHGLPGQALAVLDTDVSSIGRDGMLLKLDLMLHTGQTHDVRDVLEAILSSPDNQHRDQSDFRWLHVYLSAATGDYAEADRGLARLSDDGALVMIRLMGQYLLDRAARLAITYRDEFTKDPHLAEIACLRGLLAVELGDIDLARQQWRRSLQWFEVGPPARLARDYLTLIDMK
jgi:hypothetical protein